jgi:hypothetical protein
VAKCSFTFRFPISPEELVTKVRNAIQGAGGELDGDAEEGFYSVPTPVGVIEGSYAVSGQSIQIDVLEKPIYLSCGLIKTTLETILRREQRRNNW